MTISSGISQDDRLKIAELRKLVKDDLTEYYDTDFNLLRWLQGHAQLEVKDIARKLRHHLKARKSTWDLDNMHKLERTHPIHNHWRYGITGESDVLDNVIINIEQCGRTDYTGMMECFSVAEVMRARIYDLEVMLAQCMELEKRTGRQAWILYVMDVTGLEYNKKLYDLVTGSMRSLAEFMADHYVEMIKFFVLVNIPSFAVALWTVVRPLLPERTKSKVRILSSSNWKDEILQFSKKESLPAIWSDDTHVFPAHVDPPQQFLKEWYYSSKGLKKCEINEKMDMYRSTELWKYGFCVFCRIAESDKDTHRSANQGICVFVKMRDCGVCRKRSDADDFWANLNDNIRVAQSIENGMSACKTPSSTKGELKTFKQPENVQVIDVPAGKHHVFAIHLQQGDVVSWWVTGNRNFGFGFFRPRYEDDNDFAVMDQLIPTLPWMPGPTLTPVDDSLEIAEDGLYKFWISNERAWWWSLCAHIRIEVNSEVQDVTAGTA